MSLLSTEPRLLDPVTPRSTWKSPWKRVTVIAGFIVAGFWLIVLITVPWWAPYKPLEAVGTRLQAPSWHHLFGTDALSRDVFTRTLYGARQTIPVSVAVIVCAVAIGTILGFSFAQLLTASVLTETIFQWNGIGSYAVQSANTLDFPGINGDSLFAGLAFLLANLATDVLYAVADPKIRLA